LWNLTEQTNDADKIWLIKQADVFFDMLAIGHLAMAQQEVIVPAMGAMISEIFHSAEWSTAEIRQVARSLERYAEHPEYPDLWTLRISMDLMLIKPSFVSLASRIGGERETALDAALRALHGLGPWAQSSYRSPNGSVIGGLYLRTTEELIEIAQIVTEVESVYSTLIRENGVDVTNTFAPLEMMWRLWVLDLNAVIVHTRALLQDPTVAQAAVRLAQPDMEVTYQYDFDGRGYIRRLLGEAAGTEEFDTVVGNLEIFLRHAHRTQWHFDSRDSMDDALGLGNPAAISAGLAALAGPIVVEAQPEVTPGILDCIRNLPRALCDRWIRRRDEPTVQVFRPALVRVHDEPTVQVFRPALVRLHANLVYLGELGRALAETLLVREFPDDVLWSLERVVLTLVDKDSHHARYGRHPLPLSVRVTVAAIEVAKVLGSSLRLLDNEVLTNRVLPGWSADRIKQLRLVVASQVHAPFSCRLVSTLVAHALGYEENDETVDESAEIATFESAEIAKAYMRELEEFKRSKNRHSALSGFLPHFFVNRSLDRGAVYAWAREVRNDQIRLSVFRLGGDDVTINDMRYTIASILQGRVDTVEPLAALVERIHTLLRHIQTKEDVVLVRKLPALLWAARHVPSIQAQCARLAQVADRFIAELEHPTITDNLIELEQLDSMHENRLKVFESLQMHLTDSRYASWAIHIARMIENNPGL